VHEFHTGEGTLGGLERFKPQHGTGHALDGSMILLDDIVEILDLADFDRGAVLRIVALDGRFIGRTPVDGDLLRHTVAADRLGQEPPGGLLVPVLRLSFEKTSAYVSKKMDALDTQDDHIGTVSFVVTPKDMVTLTRVERRNFRGILWHKESPLISGLGTSYKTYVDIQAV
jgi:hypothetical protein